MSGHAHQQPSSWTVEKNRFSTTLHWQASGHCRTLFNQEKKAINVLSSCLLQLFVHRRLRVMRSPSRGICVTCILTQAVNIHGHSLDFEMFPSHVVNVQHISQRPILPRFLRCTQGAMHLKTRSCHVNNDLTKYGL